MRSLGPFAGYVIDNRVLLKPIGAPFVPAHSCTDLPLADAIRFGLLCARRAYLNVPNKRGMGFAIICFARPRRRTYASLASLQMDQLATVLMLVSVLTALACAREPSH